MRNGGASCWPALLITAPISCAAIKNWRCGGWHQWWHLPRPCHVLAFGVVCASMLARRLCGVFWLYCTTTCAVRLGAARRLIAANKHQWQQAAPSLVRHSSTHNGGPGCYVVFRRLALVLCT
jgi:hypothetical protein